MFFYLLRSWPIEISPIFPPLEKSFSLRQFFLLWKNPFRYNNNWFYPKILPLFTTKDRGFLWHSLLSFKYTCLWRSFVLTRFCTPNCVSKIVIRATSNVHAGRRFPTPGLRPRQSPFKAHNSALKCVYMNGLIVR